MSELFWGKSRSNIEPIKIVHPNLYPSSIVTNNYPVNTDSWFTSEGTEIGMRKWQEFWRQLLLLFCQTWQIFPFYKEKTQSVHISPSCIVQKIYSPHNRIEDGLVVNNKQNSCLSCLHQRINIKVQKHPCCITFWIGIKCLMPYGAIKNQQRLNQQKDLSINGERN